MMTDKDKEILQTISEKSTVLQDELDTLTPDSSDYGVMIEILTAQISVIDEIYRDIEAIITTD